MIDCGNLVFAGLPHKFYARMGIYARLGVYTRMGTRQDISILSGFLKEGP